MIPIAAPPERHVRVPIVAICATTRSARAARQDIRLPPAGGIDLAG